MKKNNAKEKIEKAKTLENAGIAGIAAGTGNMYTGALENAINDANKANEAMMYTKAQTVNQQNNLDGFIAEQHHANSFNLDAAAQGKDYKAEVLTPEGKRYGKNSVDVVIKNEDGNTVRRYQSKYGKDPKATEDLFEKGDYRGQQKLVPEGHSEEINKKSTETIEYDGVKSKPLSKKDAKSKQRDVQENEKSTKYNIKDDINTKSIAKGIHTKSLHAAGASAAISGSISLIRNIVDVANGNKEIDEATLDLIKDTGGAAVIGYGSTVIGTSLKVALSTSKDQVLKAIGESNLPAQIVTIALETGKTLTRFAKGEIDGVECIKELGEKGTGMIGAAMLGAYGGVVAASVFGKSLELPFQILGQAVIPIPIIGTLIGSMVGYTLGTLCYKNIFETAQILKEAKLAREERICIEKECKEAIAMIRQYRQEMEQLVSKYLIDHITTFHTAFDGIKSALNLGDIDGFIAGTNTITKKLGKTPQFENYQEFNTLMESDVSLKL